MDAEGWFSTGDVATIDSWGHMAITDRSKVGPWQQTAMVSTWQSAWEEKHALWNKTQAEKQLKRLN